MFFRVFQLQNMLHNIRLHHLFYKFQPFPPTIEDIYEAYIDTDRGTKESVRFYDTQGIETSSPSIKEDLPKHLLLLADAFIIVYSIDDDASFQVAEAIRKEIEKQTKEKKETIIVLLGNKCDLLAKRKVDSVQALNWASRERYFQAKIVQISKPELYSFNAN